MRGFYYHDPTITQNQILFTKKALIRRRKKRNVLPRLEDQSATCGLKAFSSAAQLQPSRLIKKKKKNNVEKAHITRMTNFQNASDKLRYRENTG